MACTLQFNKIFNFKPLINTMKNTIYIAAFTLTSFAGTAQTLQDAINKTESERFDAAATDLRALIAKEPAKGENYYYMGENYFKSGKFDGFQNRELDSASMYYNKGVEVNATSPFNYIGLGKVLLSKNNVNDAKTQFFKALSISQNKNAAVMREIAEAWLATDNKNPDEAIAQANNAIKLDPKNPDNYIILGDAQLEKTPSDGGPAIKSYKMATTLNPKSAKGIIREGKLYQRGRNYQLALDKYKEAEAIDASFAPAYREKAELYFLAGQNLKSIENWKKYLELNNSNFARYRFMSALFKNKQYAEAIAEYENLKKANFNNIYLERIAAYSYAEMGDKTDKEAYNKGLATIEEFFKKAPADFKYLGSDYKYKGILLMRTGKDSLGILEMEKAIATDPTIAGEVYTEVANSAYKAKKYDKAITYFEKKITADPKTMNNNDWFALARSYYYSGGAKQTEAAAIKDAKKKAAMEAEATPFYVKADSALAQLVKLNPSWPTAYTWRGRTNSLIDPKAEKDFAKTHYEKVLSTVKPEEKTTTYKRDVVEALEYLGYYYVTKKDKAKADEIFTQLKEIDPANEKAKNYFNPPKQGTKPAGKQ
jgi:tetratricopeptide (TPR) repeat protein